MNDIFLAGTKQLNEWYFLSVTPFSLCFHHRIIMKFSGVITDDQRKVHAKGQRSRLQRSKPNLTASGPRVLTGLEKCLNFSGVLESA